MSPGVRPVRLALHPARRFNQRFPKRICPDRDASLITQMLIVPACREAGSKAFDPFSCCRFTIEQASLPAQDFLAIIFDVTNLLDHPRGERVVGLDETDTHLTTVILRPAPDDRSRRGKRRLYKCNGHLYSCTDR